MLHDLRCPPQALRAAAAWVLCEDDAPDVTLDRAGAQLIVRQGTRSTSFAAGDPAGTQRLHLTPQALRAAGEWAETGEGMADVEVLVDDRMLLVSQGDDRTGFDTGGELASEEYLAVAPLDRTAAPPERS